VGVVKLGPTAQAVSSQSAGATYGRGEKETRRMKENGFTKGCAWTYTFNHVCM